MTLLRDGKKEVLVTRLKSLAWRLGMMVVAGGIAFFLDNLDVFAFNPTVTALLGLVLGEVSKQINSELNKPAVQ